MVVKTYGSCYLYTRNKNIYESKIKEFLIKCERIDKSSENFKAIKYEVSRRQMFSAISRVLDSDAIVLTRGTVSLPSTFKVFSTADPVDGRPKVFIDCTGLIRNMDGVDRIASNDVDKFVAYLLNAIIVRVYSSNRNSCLNGAINTGAVCFAKMMAYVIDILRVGSVEKCREKVLYLSSYYYLKCVAKAENTDKYMNDKAVSISGLTAKEAELVMFRLPDFDIFENIDTFIQGLSIVLNCDLRTINFTEKWLYLFGSSTLFGLEYFPAFSAIMTDAYAGSYLNNQKTIEKVVGINLMNAYAKEISKVCQECV